MPDVTVCNSCAKQCVAVVLSTQTGYDGIYSGESRVLQLRILLPELCKLNYLLLD